MIEKWKVLDRWEIFKNRFINLRVDRCELPDGRLMPDYYVLDFVPWVHVIPVTKNGQIVMIRQYRHGAGEVFWEIPGGTTHPSTGDEDPLMAAKRELLEETGYESDTWKLIGEHFPNPALQSNQMLLYLAQNCEKVAEPLLDPFEDIEVELMPIKDVFDRAESGGIKHSIVLAGLMMARRHLLEDQ